MLGIQVLRRSAPLLNRLAHSGAQDVRGVALESVEGGSVLKKERLSKFIAQSGLGSRRDAELWVKSGRVTVNGKVVASPAEKITTLVDSVIVDGVPVVNYVPQRSAGRLEIDRPRIWALSKLRGELVALHDRNKGRPLLFDRIKTLIRGYNPEKLRPVDRLDFNSEGLMLMTNHPSLSRYLNSDAAALVRVYKVRVHGLINKSKISALQRGAFVRGIKYKPFSVTLERQSNTISWLTLTMKEDQSRAIQKVLGKLALRPLRIIRTDFGPFSLEEMPAGSVKELRLTPQIVSAWRKSI
jgi:23S rRNA pseudouridine2605 synthase